MDHVANHVLTMAEAGQNEQPTVMWAGPRCHQSYKHSEEKTGAQLCNIVILHAISVQGKHDKGTFHFGDTD